MQEIITRLKLDHQRLAKVLHELEVVANEVDRGTAGSDQLFCLLDYLAEYPHQIHHPTEDLIFGELLKKTLTTEQQQIVEGNARQHIELEQKTAELMEYVDAAEHRFAAPFECLGVQPDKMRARGADAVARFLGATRG